MQLGLSLVDAHVALQFLALFGVFGGEVVRHLGEFDAVGLLAVFGLQDGKMVNSVTFFMLFKGSVHVLCKCITNVTQQLSSFLGLGDVQTALGLPADSFHPVQVRAILVLQSSDTGGEALEERAMLANSSPLIPSYLALERICLLGLLHLDVVGHDRVVVQPGAVLQVTGQRLGLLGVAQIDHVLGKCVVGLALLGALLVLNLRSQR